MIGEVENVKLVSIGDCVADCYLDEGMFYPGGQAVNVAANAKLDGAEEASYLGILGDDDVARYIGSVLQGLGVGLERCRKAYGLTPMPGVRIIDGDRVFFRGKRDSVAHLFRLGIAQEDLDYIARFDICHTTNEARIDGDLGRIHKAIPLSYDFSTGHDEKTLEALCPNVDFAFFSGEGLSDEECLLLARKAAATGSETAIVTKGMRGSIALRDGKLYEQPVVPCRAVDAMGAGDSFAAAFLVRYADSHDVSSALSFAAERASHTCTIHGAFGHPHAICP